jgi:phosphatidylethanolamine-binding protein (PEBP) family uncharacterized protein
MQTPIASLLIPLACALPAVAYANESHHHGQKSLEVTSSAFKAGDAIPSEYTCEGANKAPPLAWANLPAETKSVAVLVDDPDAPKGTFTHWLVTDLPPTTTSLGDSGKIPAGYTGPCPPSGRHHYHFHVYAIDTKIGEQASRADFLSAIRGHVLAEGDLVAMYEKANKK